MANAHGKDSYVKFANAADVETDFTSQTTRINWKPTAKNSDSTAMGSAAKTRIAGQKDASFSIDGWFDSISTGFARALYRARGKIKAFTIGPEGSTAGKTRITGSAILTGFNIKPSIDGTVPFTATFAISGAWVEDTF